MYPRSFLREDAKINIYTSEKKEFCKVDQEAIRESRFTCFIIYAIRNNSEFKKIPCNSNNFPHIEKILRTAAGSLVLQRPLKFQVDRIKFFRVLVLAELKNVVSKKTCLKF